MEGARVREDGRREKREREKRRKIEEKISSGD